MFTRSVLAHLFTYAGTLAASSGWAITLGDRNVDIEAGVAARGYLEASPVDQAQESLAGRLKVAYYDSSDDGVHHFEFVGEAQWDLRDDERRRADIQDLAWLYVADDWELRTGIRKVFWGVTEAQNLVDIINQSDFARFPDGEDKLGQPMINLSLTQLPGILDVFVLFGHRERLFPGEDGRFGGGEVISPHSQYESGDEEHRVDAAIRWQHYWRSLNIAVSHFSGTARAPELGGRDDQDRLIAFYPVIDQSGLELQAILGNWNWKAEWVTVSGYASRYSAGTAGFEYTQVGILGSAMDLGWVVEGSFDDRKEASPSANERDILLANRLTVNDIAGSSLLAGATIDTQTGETLAVLQAERRLGDDMKLLLDAVLVLGSRSPSTAENASGNTEYKLAEVSDDSFVQLEWVFYF